MFTRSKDWNGALAVAIVLSASACSTALADPPGTLIRNAALVLTMDSAVGAGESGVLEQADMLCRYAPWRTIQLLSDHLLI